MDVAAAHSMVPACPSSAIEAAWVLLEAVRELTPCELPEHGLTASAGTGTPTLAAGTVPCVTPKCGVAAKGSVSGGCCCHGTCCLYLAAILKFP